MNRILTIFDVRNACRRIAERIRTTGRQDHRQVQTGFALFALLIFMAGCSVPTAVVTTPAVATAVSADALVPKVSTLAAHLPVMTVLWTNGNCRCYSNLIIGTLFTNCNCCTPPPTNFIVAGVTVPIDAPQRFFRTAIDTNGYWLQSSPAVNGPFTNYVALPIPSGTGSVTLAWNASTDPSVAGYNVYYGGASGVYTNKIPAGNTTNATISGLIQGTTYYFAATTYTSSGMESPFSSEVSYLLPVPFTITKG